MSHSYRDKIFCNEKIKPNFNLVHLVNSIIIFISAGNNQNRYTHIIDIHVYYRHVICHTIVVSVEVRVLYSILYRIHT